MKSKFFGFNIPIFAGSAILPFQSDERLIKNDILQILLTIPGERIMRSDFGCNLNSMLFEQNTSENRSTLRSSIYQAISNFEKRVYITESDVSVVSDVSDSNILNVKIRCRYTPENFDNSFILDFNINVSTGQIERAITG